MFLYLCLYLLRLTWFHTWIVKCFGCWQRGGRRGRTVSPHPHNASLQLWHSDFAWGDNTEWPRYAASVTHDAAGLLCCLSNVDFPLILIHVQSHTAPHISFAPLQTCSNCVLFFLHICIFNKVFGSTLCGNIITESILAIFILNILLRLTITASCPMDLQYFPMDSQLCYIEIESCKYWHLKICYSQ